MKKRGANIINKNLSLPPKCLSKLVLNGATNVQRKIKLELNTVYKIAHSVKLNTVYKVTHCV